MGPVVTGGSMWTSPRMFPLRLPYLSTLATSPS